MINIKIEESNSLPKCPYCEKELDRVAHTKKIGNLLGQDKIYICPHCKKILGIGA